MASDTFVAFVAGSLLAWGAGRVRRKYGAWREATRDKRAAADAREKKLQRNEAAEALLKKSGYAVVGRDARAAYAITVDGEPQVVNVAADFLVEREGKRMVAEVQTGVNAKLATPTTRWLLLEQQHAFGNRAVLLVDPDTGALATIRFPLAQTALTAVPPPLPRARETSQQAQRQQKRAAALVRRRRWVKYAIASALVGVVWWMLRSDEEPDAAAEPARPAPRQARLPRAR